LREAKGIDAMFATMADDGRAARCDPRARTELATRPSSPLSRFATGNLHPAVPGFPLVEGPIRDPVASAHFVGRRARLLLAQDREICDSPNLLRLICPPFS